MFQHEIKQLSERRKIFLKDRINDPHALVKEQQENWSAINQALLTVLDPIDPIVATIKAFENHISKPNSGGLLYLEESKDEVALVGRIPLISTEIKDYLGNVGKQDPMRIIACMFAEFGYEIYQITNLDVKLKASNPISNAAILYYVSTYRAETALASNMQGKVADGIITQLRSGQNKVSELQNQLRGLIEEAEAKTNSLLRGLEERKALASVAGVWASKKLRHDFVFWVGFLSLCFALLALFVKAVENQEVIFAFFDKVRNSKEEIPYSTLLLLLIPVFAAAWLLRIFGRVLTISLTLSSDAQLRQAMLETYLQLVSDEKSGIDKSERPVVLAAMFRPLPGQENDDVQPPSLFDLLKSKDK